MRLFVAIALNDAVKAELRKAQRALAAFDRTARWVTQDQMHLTLKFLGEVPDAQVEAICTAAGLAAAAMVPFELTVGGCGCFPPKGPVRVVWVGTEEPGGVLARGNEACEAHYAELGFPREGRPFSPHLTLGRVRDDATAGKLRQAVSAMQVARHRQPVKELCVVQSTLTPQGARYAIVSRHPLGSA